MNSKCQLTVQELPWINSCIPHTPKTPVWIAKTIRYTGPNSHCVHCVYKKTCLKEGEVRWKSFLTKLLSRLSHKVCCLLSRPVLMRKLNNVSARPHRTHHSDIQVRGLWSGFPQVSHRTESLSDKLYELDTINTGCSLKNQILIRFLWLGLKQTRSMSMSSLVIYWWQF